MLLDGKVAIITGAARGTGSAIARTFVAQGAHVELLDVRAAEGSALAAELGVHATFHEADITDEAAWTRVVHDVVGRRGAIDVLVNNAAVLHLGGIEHTSLADLRRLLDINMVGAFLGTKAVVKLMRANGGGSIVNIASIDALVGMNGVSAYTASKWALRGFTKAAAIELGRDRIRVNTVCPGGGNAEMYAPWADRLAALSAEVEAYRRNRAIPGEVSLSEIADVALFLASDLSRMVTGVDIAVDGGQAAGHHFPGLSAF